MRSRLCFDTIALPKETGHMSAHDDRMAAVTIRSAGPADAADVDRLAQLETRRPTPGPHLLALRDSEVVAAISLATAEILADPFRPTADVQALLRLQAKRARRAKRRPTRRGLWRLAPLRT
jgi:hypothetical protein